MKLQSVLFHNIVLYFSILFYFEYFPDLWDLHVIFSHHIVKWPDLQDSM